MKVVIAEKPSVARDLAKVLKATTKHDGYIEGNGYAVTWALGHLIQLANPDAYDKKFKSWSMQNLPIIPETFETELISSKGSKEQFKVIKGLLSKKDVDEVICATDAGREGELIFRLIYSYAKCTAPIKRLWISSQTDKAIKDGFAALKTGEEYQPLYDSALSRAQADWLVGMNSTRAYSTALSRGNGVMSVGRVQTPVLKMIVDRYLEHSQFVPQTFYEIFVDVHHPNGVFSAKWFDKEDDRLFDKAKAEAVFQSVKASLNGTIAKLTQKEKKENPPLLYDLTELQRDANRRFKFPAEKTLKTAQSLYEKHKVLTYPRTSSRYLSEDLIPKLPELFQNLIDSSDYGVFAKSVLNEKLRVSNRTVDDKKVTDHHAIIPTEKKANVEDLSPDERKIYDLVIKRFLAAFFPVCVKHTTEIITEFGSEQFRTFGTIVKDAGWRAVYGTMSDDEDDESDSKKKKKDSDKKGEALLPSVAEQDAVKHDDAKLEEGQTKPPALYNEASILSAMETAGKHVEDEALREAMKECGLGTPATRAQIIERLIEVAYIIRDKNRLIPTDKGIFLIENIRDKELLSPELTGQWEKKLNDMAQNKYSREAYMDEIKAFTRQVVAKLKTDSDEPSMEGEVIGKCPVCSEGDVVESVRTYGCNRKESAGCEFAIWKNIAGKNITRAVAKALLTEGKTPLISGFKSKAGKPFEAVLVINEGKVSFNFDREPLGKCPVCQIGEVVSSPRAYSCSRWREGCKLAIWKQVAGKTITEEIAKDLIAEGKTEVLEGFKSKAGKYFKAGLVMENGQVKLDFVEEPNTFKGK